MHHSQRAYLALTASRFAHYSHAYRMFLEAILNTSLLTGSYSVEIP